jgi:choline dehydrogenase-like flavoprotein
MPIARYRKCMATGTCKYCPFGARFTAQAVLDDLREDPRYVNFEVRTNSPARRLLTSSKDEIDGVLYADNLTGETKIVRAENYIICSGAYETPKLLMMSKSLHWKNGIGNDHDLLGRFIISHSMLKVRGSTPTNKERWFQEFDFPTLMSRSYDTPEEQKTGKLFLFKNRVLPNIDIAAMMIQGLSPKEIERRVSGPMELEVQAFMEEKGKFENRLEIMEGTDRFGLPLTKITFSRNDVEQANTQQQLALMSEVIRAMNYKIVYAQTEDPGAHHTTGTCRMAATPEEGVTDPNLQVHGSKNLYLCSNGVFPSGSAVNPTLTLTALAMRLADHLLRRPILQTQHVESPVPVA